MTTLLTRLARDERGQDTIEYVFLTASLAFVGLATWPGIEVAIRNAYQALDTNTQGLWEPPNPGGGS
jgi:Flp pilus assembly pilin Flp